MIVLIVLCFLPMLAQANHFGLFFQQLCRLGTHRQSTSCLSNTQSCTTATGYGTQTWNGSDYSVCSLSGCNTNYTLYGGACYANNVACGISNGSGTQVFNGAGGYGVCTVATCNAPYYDRGDNLSCVQSGITYGRGGLSLAQNNSISTGGLNLSMQSDGNLVVYNGGTPFWASGVGYGCNGSCATNFQSDGNLVSKQDNPFVLFFQSNSAGGNGASFTFKNDCPYYLVVHNSAGKAIWTNKTQGGFPNNHCF